KSCRAVRGPDLEDRVEARWVSGRRHLGNYSGGVARRSLHRHRCIKASCRRVGPLPRSPRRTASLATLGTGVGGLVMAWLAERLSRRCVVVFGPFMVCAGLTLSSGGEVCQLGLGH